ncbi:hypothetical protein GNI_070660 [Gregarina niphandrodes]|uniref:Uncharacterized protein n=1 Tax=Gregarina niphandrodes TaxID=110365 RepID=A0A023B7B5_GRENI|nr:hypothetical protein GNI_070660 [Gregarina niphandrodes]EZG67201.1 hypothetical protein GNI_070660 [Gregarina niphandrodes]|eukprot:XP_011130307.1 hypothetical protein GNI_070660 [Gregarina niphandrodes]
MGTELLQTSYQNGGWSEPFKQQEDEAATYYAILFSQLLLDKEFDKAYGMLSDKCKTDWTRESLEADFATMIENMGGEGSVEPDPISFQRDPEMFCYVPIGADGISEAVTVTMTCDPAMARKPAEMEAIKTASQTIPIAGHNLGLFSIDSIAFGRP